MALIMRAAELRTDSMIKPIAITGASGFIGQQLVPLLVAKGHQIVLIGRDKNRLEKLFPGQIVAQYSELPQAFEGVDAILHLAVLNNDVDATLTEFEEANVHLLKHVVEGAKAAQVQQLTYTATTHVSLDRSLYGRSKAQAEEILRATDGLDIAILRLPIVYGQSFAGKLAALNELPRPIASMLFPIIASLKPTLHATRLADAVSAALDAAGSNESLVTDQQRNNWFYQLVRRVVDVSFCLSIIVVFWWLLLGVWIAVRSTSKGPGIFAQNRVGCHGKPFTIYKFRTMAKGTKQAGSHEISNGSLTSVGGFLRKTKIDELPQIWNILRGDISLIGPRPCLPNQTELVAARTARNVLDILPGITGYAQVRHIDMSDPELLAKTDEKYMKLRTLPLDFKILLQTFLGRGNGDRIKGGDA